MLAHKKSSAISPVLPSPGVPRRTKQGNVVKPFTIEPRHWDALRREAFRRAAEAGLGKPDASAVLREVLDAWIAKGRGKSS
jgi:hypothetical protein